MATFQNWAGQVCLMGNWNQANLLNSGCSMKTINLYEMKVMVDSVVFTVVGFIHNPLMSFIMFTWKCRYNVI